MGVITHRITDAQAQDSQTYRFINSTTQNYDSQNYEQTYGNADSQIHRCIRSLTYKLIVTLKHLLNDRFKQSLAHLFQNQWSRRIADFLTQ